MSQALSARYYKKTKKRFKKFLVKDIKIFLKKKPPENKNKFANDKKVSRKMKNKA